MERREFPFLESLLSFQELNYEELAPALSEICDSWEKWITQEDRDAVTAAMVKIGKLKTQHIYFQLLYTRCYNNISVPHHDDENRQLWAEIQEAAAQLPQYQKQIQRFFELVLDVDQAGREPQKQAWRSYDHNGPKDPALFKFRPIPLSFEPTEENRCSPVLYSASIPDMIDYSLRTCVERNITVRRCKNCGRWFPQMVRVSAEYCERPVPRGEQVCREIGLSSSGRRSSRMTRSSRHTARSIRSALRGSRRGASRTRRSMHGARKPEKRKRNVTEI